MILIWHAFLIVAYIAIGVILFTALWGALAGAPWVPTRGKDTHRMIELAKVKSGDVIYDLGSGDGRLVFESAKKGAKAFGIEIFVLPWLYSKIRGLKIKGSKIIFGDFFKKDISDADVVFIFLLEKCYTRLADKFKKELKSGTRVIVACWPIKELEDKLIERNKPVETVLPMYVYKM